MTDEHRLESEFFWDRVRTLSFSRYGGWVGLAERSGLSAGFIRKAYANRSVPMGATAARIADALHVPAASLFPQWEGAGRSRLDRVVDLAIANEGRSDVLDVAEAVLRLPLRLSPVEEEPVRDDE